MAIMSQEDKKTSVDFRNYNMIKPNRRLPYKLPIEIEEKLCQLLNHFKLNFASIDLMVRGNNFYFLEINPVGQFGMVSGPCNYKIEKLIAKYIIENNANR